MCMYTGDITKYITEFWFYEIIYHNMEFFLLYLLANVSMYFQGKILGVFFGNGDCSSSSNFCTGDDSKESQNVPKRNGYPFLNGFEMDYDQTQTSCVWIVLLIFYIFYFLNALNIKPNDSQHGSQ